ncbi:hypothetical protein ACMFWY_22460 [Roseiconus sp. JC912]
MAKKLCRIGNDEIEVLGDYVALRSDVFPKMQIEVIAVRIY